jgi:hypothetical protein
MCGDYILLAQDRVERRAFMNTVMNLRVPKKGRKFLDQLSDCQFLKKGWLWDCIIPGRAKIFLSP